MKWHKRIQTAIEELGEDNKFILLKPSKIYYELGDGRLVEYHPDCIWTSTGLKHLNMVIWEIESGGNFKNIAGDIQMASMAKSSHAKLFTKNMDHPMGQRFKKPHEFRNRLDKRKKIVINPENHLKLRRPEYLSFMLVLSGKRDYQEYSRYLDLISNNRPSPFLYAGATWTPARSVSNAKKSLSQDGKVKKLFQ